MMKLFLMISALAVSASMQAQQVYQLTEPAQPKLIRSNHLRMGGVNPQGERIDVNSFYMSMAGKPVIPVMGEFHYSRYPAGHPPVLCPRDSSRPHSYRPCSRSPRR